MKNILNMLVIILFSICSISAQQTEHDVTIVGAMKNVMRKGQLEGNIHIDSIPNKKHLYGFGPIEYLRGEILIIDGASYVSTVLNDTSMNVEVTYNVKAPFFAYTNINNWTEQLLNDSIQTITQLEQFLDGATINSTRPFMFRLSGTVEKATIHIVNLPEGSKVNSPDDVFKTQKSFHLTNEESEIVGFFSTEHKTIFTHHDTYLHLHLITADRNKMGHLDEVFFKPGSMKLYLPAG